MRLSGLAVPLAGRHYKLHGGAQSAASLMSRCEDNCALIRLDWVTCCVQVGERYGVEWLTANVVPQLVHLSESKNYQLKVRRPPCRPPPPAAGSE